MNPLIIKLGGVLLDSEEALERLFTALVNYREAHQRPLIIVHGGGCVVDELMKQLNLLRCRRKMACALRRLSKSTSSPRAGGYRQQDAAGVGEKTWYFLGRPVPRRWR